MYGAKVAMPKIMVRGRKAEIDRRQSLYLECGDVLTLSQGPTCRGQRPDEANLAAASRRLPKR